jgi:hypothetical protein
MEGWDARREQKIFSKAGTADPAGAAAPYGKGYWFNYTGG